MVKKSQKIEKVSVIKEPVSKSRENSTLLTSMYMLTSTQVFMGSRSLFMKLRAITEDRLPFVLPEDA